MCVDRALSRVCYIKGMRDCVLECVRLIDTD